MDLQTLFYYEILLGGFAVGQIVLTLWSLTRTHSLPLALLTLFIPFVGVPWTLVRLRESHKDNQAGGALTYLGVILASAFLIWKLPPDETPWMVIFTMEFFAGLGLLNVIDLAVTTDDGTSRG